MRLPKALTVGFLTAVLVALQASPALAHAQLTDTNPADGETLAEMPSEIRLEFNEELSRPSQIRVQGPDGDVLAEGDADLDGPAVFAELEDPGLAGTYCVSYRVISADAHPVTGELSFDVTAGDEPEETVACGDEAEEEDDEGAAAPWYVWVALGVGVLGAGLVLWRTIAGRG